MCQRPATRPSLGDRPLRPYLPSVTNEHTEAAQRTLKEKGKVAGLRELRRNVADVRGGGDPEAINYHSGVLKAFEELVSNKHRDYLI